jgi:hypothetical protein
MSKSLMLALGVFLVAAILLGGSLLFRGESSSPVAPRTAPAPAASTTAAAFVPAEVADPELVKRVEEMEGRLSGLLKRRDELAKSNASIQKEIKGIGTERSLKDIAPGFVEMLGRQAGGLTESQRAPLAELWIRWHKEDQVEEAWRSESVEEIRRRLLDRESELRGLLSADQQTKLHDTAERRIKSNWERAAMEIANELGYPIGGVSRETYQASVNKVLPLMGAPPASPSSAMMLSGAYGVDASSLRRLAIDRAGTQLSSEDLKRLQEWTPDMIRAGIAASWHFDLQ